MAKRLADIAKQAVEAAAAPAASTTQRKENAKERAAIDRGLAEVRVERIRVDGLALMKIIKHSREAHAVLPAPAGTSNATASFSPAVGQLLGIDSDGTLEISNTFALPSGALGGSSSSTGGEGEGSESKGVKAANKYTASFLPRLADLNADASLVGFYTSTNNGQHLAIPGFVDALLGAQLAGGGLGANSARAAPVGKAAAKPMTEISQTGKGIALVFDVASSTQGHVSLRAFRLTPAFIAASRAHSNFDTASLIAHKLVPSTILEELPVTIRSSPLLTAFLSTLPATRSASSSFASLELPSPSAPGSLIAPLGALLTSLETHQAHLSTLSFQSRQLARDRTRVEALPSVIKRRQENEQRQKEGLPLLPPAPEEAALTEPNRLETMCALAGVEGAAKTLSEAAGVALVRSYGAKAGIV